MLAPACNNKFLLSWPLSKSRRLWIRSPKVSRIYIFSRFFSMQAILKLYKKLAKPDKKLAFLEFSLFVICKREVKTMSACFNIPPLFVF